MTKNPNSDEKPAQKPLARLDEHLKEQRHQVDDEIFNHQERLTSLRDRKFTSEKDTIFSAIFQELKKRKTSTDRKTHVLI
jgi:hypothetical protein